ncbi:Ovule protein [Caenorhabditis elegans]|uniref:Ovule protein n=1 Tax=Caenorhabditis elegans TaxID=6239 RepID=U4PMY0_CAEEL|nr:Ovule protein [Caenorhabditis elegans]CDH93449.1 Ovule protein [Caenorhabditis elegans]|eukprot:NP_001294775.1 Uncharacterized protein CELE_K04A8.20 [Caenorhabditis elegans]
MNSISYSSHSSILLPFNLFLRSSSVVWLLPHLNTVFSSHVHIFSSQTLKRFALHIHTHTQIFCAMTTETARQFDLQTTGIHEGIKNLGIICMMLLQFQLSSVELLKLFMTETDI